MRQIVLAAVAGVVFLASFSLAAPPRPLVFAELWNNCAYYETNLERKNFASLLGRFEGKIGLNLFDSPLQLYGVYYGSASQSSDYWNNAIYSGAGVRFKPLEGYEGSGWLTEWVRDVKFFAEGLSASYQKNAASAEADGLKKSDTRYGLEVWHEWNLDKPDLSNYWGELWANLSSRSTNFSTTESGSYIFYLQPKVGRHLGSGVEVYLRGDLTASDKSDYWLNVADYGVGIRFEPWRETHGADSILKKFKMFAEILNVSYLRDKPSDPAQEVASDLRFGIDFSYGR